MQTFKETTSCKPEHRCQTFAQAQAFVRIFNRVNNNSCNKTEQKYTSQTSRNSLTNEFGLSKNALINRPFCGDNLFTGRSRSTHSISNIMIQTAGRCDPSANYYYRLPLLCTKHLCSASMPCAPISFRWAIIVTKFLTYVLKKMLIFSQIKRSFAQLNLPRRTGSFDQLSCSSKQPALLGKFSPAKLKIRIIFSERIFNQL